MACDLEWMPVHRRRFSSADYASRSLRSLTGRTEAAVSDQHYTTVVMPHHFT